MIPLLLAGCVPASMTQRLALLEGRVASLEASEAAAPQPTGPSQAQETTAAELYGTLQEAVEKADWAEARLVLENLTTNFAGTRGANEARRVAAEIAVVGRNIAATPEAAVWLQGVDPDLSTGRTLVVFFETWCPHCQREVPALPERFGDRDTEVLLVTKVTRSSTDAEVMEFLGSNNLAYPTLKDNGSLSDEFSIQGIPAAALVEDGEVVWRGHPARLTGELLDILVPER